MANNKTYCFIEKTTTLAWCCYVLPYLFGHLSSSTLKGVTVYYIDTTVLGKFFADITCIILGCNLKVLDFKLAEIKDENKELVRERIAFQDMMQVQDSIVSSEEFKSFYEKAGFSEAFKHFLRRRTISFNWRASFTMLKLVYLIEVVHWKMEHDLDKSVTDRVMFVHQRYWSQYVIPRAQKYGITLRFMKISRINLKSWIQKIFGQESLRSWYFFIRDKGLIAAIKLLFGYSSKGGAAEKSEGHKLLVEYYGHLYLDQPKFLSELFFWQRSDLKSEDISVLFNIKRDPLDEDKEKQLNEYGMGALVFNPLVNRSNQVPTSHNICFLKQRSFDFVSVASGNKWFKEQARTYNQQYAFWRSLFEENQIKMYVSWYKYSDVHCAMADALKSCNGALALYQRAFEEFGAADRTITTDVYFAWSKLSMKAEKESKSVIPYFIQTGYLGEHRFDLLKNDADAFRAKVMEAGAEQVIAFFDEQSQADERWHTGHSFMRANYVFILEKLLSEPWMGLLIKPKTPYTLKKRLGPVAELLDKALATGRCIVISHDECVGASYVPAVAAISADIAIHAHLCAATAGLEAALMGIPTLLLDREGWYRSPFYDLGYGKTAFDDWNSLWDVCTHYLRVNKEEDIGNWSSIINEADPFRDGKAAMRMGTYLKWMMEGFKEGLPRETVLADAAERYAQQWGKDKVLSVN